MASSDTSLSIQILKLNCFKASGRSSLLPSFLLSYSFNLFVSECSEENWANFPEKHVNTELADLGYQITLATLIENAL